MRWKVSPRLLFVQFLILPAWLAAQVPPPQVAPAQGAQPLYDWLFLGGRVMDGSGNPWFPADVAVSGGRIAAIGNLSQARARRTVSAQGKLIVPGFIDIHSHADDAVRRMSGLRSSESARRSAPNLVSQGITTVVVNQDGRSPWPIGEQKAALQELGIGPNAILLAGHGTIRRQVMQDDFRRPASQEEVEQMRQLMRQAIREGALGLSAGLEYVPGRWSSTDELVALVQEIVPVQGVYISHQRSEGSDPMWYWPSQDSSPPSLLDAVRETIEIGARTGATVVASHIKAKGAHYWGSGQAAILLIERARAEGVDVWADQYPYDTTGSDGNTVLIPRWIWRLGETEADSAAASGNGEESRPGFAGLLKKVLQDPLQAAQLRRDISHEITRRGGAQKIVVFDYPEDAAVGKSLAELASARGIEPVEMAIRLQLEGFSDRPGGARLRGFSLSEEDIRLYIARPWTATSSDAGIALPEDGPVHARFYGTFPRKIRRYALDGQVISLEQAIRSSTSLPAQILRLKDRGLLREGYAADLVVLDLENLHDRATFFKPHQYAQGVEYVLVNGQAVVENTRLTGALPGQVLAR
ncbi:MAG: amidohydrolase family protein [Acidobacteriota bacterium]